MDGAGESADDGREDPTLALVAVRDRAGPSRRTDVTLEDRGMYLLKGIDGDWRPLAAARQPGRLARRLGLSRSWWRSRRTSALFAI
jgi:hypothetical protein